MNRKEDLLEEKNDAETSSLPVSFEEYTKKEENAPESYYSDITEVGVKEDRYYEIFEKSKHKTRSWSVVALALAAVSVFCSWFGWIGLIFGICAIILSVVSRITLGYFDGVCICGLILGIFGVVFSGTMIIIDIVMASGVFDTYLAGIPFKK